MLINWIICGLLFLASGFDGVRTYDDSVSNRIDHSVLLKCPIDIATCGALHSVKWFKGNVRIAVVSGDGGVANVKEEFKGRMSIEHSQEGPYTYLSITSLQISDEDIYTCESTFLEPVEACNTAGAFRIELKVEVPPASIQLFDENGAHLKNGTTLGPLREGNTLKTVCDVKETRPIPTIGWYRGDRRLTDSVTVDETNGLFSVKSELSMILSRQELGTKIECRITTPAIEKMVTNYVLLDLQVRPTTINMFGVKHHVVQDSIVSLVCEVTGARPPANISWYNSTILMDPLDRTRTEFQTSTFLHNDGTFTTNSTLKFTASRFEHGETIRCEADNIVMKDEREKPLHKTQVFNVLYPPVVVVKPENVTVNETQEFLLFCDYEANPATLEVVRWLKNGEPLNINQSRFEGGNSEHTALSVKDSSRDDDGVYTCELTNSVGKSVSDNEINVDVQFVPTVELTMEPDVPVIENNQANVTLYCNVIHGNPSTLLRVRWFLEGGLLKELPDCNINSDSEDLCNIDPSKLLLEDIGRDFLGNYSCEGMNSAGWGERSAENDLIVYYKPGNATLAHHPQIAIKKKSVTFSCSVEDTGLPTATKYKWLRGGSPVMDLVTPIWTVDPVGLDTRTNFSCSAFNDAGLGNPATIELDVHAPPAFIHKMSPYTGVLFSAKNASLQCRIECIPKCSISWFKDGLGIPETDERFFIKEKYLPAEPATGDFESIYSVLHFNMSAWPQEKFDMHTDNANFSCVSSNNSVGPGVRSATYFSVEYPPENTTVTNRVVDVIEDNIPERVLCTAKANPEPTFEWYHGEDLVSRSSALIINQVMKRDKAGTYKCKSQNKHGAHFENIEIRVLYPPACEISRRDIDDKDTLICTADGNPAQAGFSWLQKLENQSIELEGGRIDGYSSYLELKEDTVTRTYRCVANNTVGPGMFCEIEVAVRPKRHVAWWKSWNRTTQIILMAAILAILAVIILCCIIICICRRRRRQNKYHTDVSISATQSVLSYQASTPLPTTSLQTSSEIPKSPPKWPLRPGVMVHVKGDTKQNLRANRMNSTTPNPRVTTVDINTNPVNIVEAQISSLSVMNSSNRSIRINEQIDNVNSIRPVPLPRPPKSNTIRVNPNNSILTDNNLEQSNIIQSLPSDDDRPPPPILPKRNLPVSRNSTNRNNFSGNSTNELLPRSLKKTRKSRTSDNDEDDDSNLGCRPLNTNEANTTSGPNGSGLFEKIFGEIFNRQNSNEDPSQRTQFRNLFGLSRIFGRQRSNGSNPFATEHRLKGIRCSGGVVTYKKTPILNRPIASLVDSNSNALLGSGTAPKNESDTTKQIHGKSSALGDPLTEPGEYENLPFHGLQTAPNKFATTPINFNSTNVVRVTPRPKLINNNQLQQQQQQQLHQIQQQQSLKPPFSTMTSSSQTLLLSSSSATNPANDGAGGVVSGNNIRTNNDSTTNCIGPSNTISSGSKTIPSNSNQINYNLSNCFPTSYTAYYNQQQQQKTLVNNSQIGNSFINNFPYTVENSTGQYNGIIDNGIPCSGAGQRISGFNPFIVNNLKKFNTNSGCRQAGHRKKPQIENNEKKFYSLKSLGNRKGLHFCSMKPSTLGLLTSNSKCKRHHSFAGGSAGDIVSDIGGTNTLPFITQTHTKMKFYEPPLYENLTDSIQIHESSLGNFQHPSQQQQQQQQQNLQNSQNQKQHHSKHSHHHHHHHQQQQHQLQHQKIDDFNNLMEPERLSIYRSDSGISNSSYECITPIPAPRQLLTQQKSHHSLTRCQKSPVYMNLSGTTPSSSSSIIGQSLSIATSTPNQSNIVNPPPPPPSLPSSSSSTNPSSSSCGDGGGGIPLASSSSSSLSIHVNHHHQNSPSCNNVNNINNNSNSNNNNNGNSCNNHCNGANSCNQSNNNANNSKDKCHQHQQQQHKQQHFQHHSHHSGKSINRKCKKRGTPATATQSSASASLLSLERVPNTNPFIVTSACSNPKVHRGNGVSSSSSNLTTTSRCHQTHPQQQNHQRNQSQQLVPKELFPLTSTPSKCSSISTKLTSVSCANRIKPNPTIHNFVTKSNVIDYNSDNNLTYTNADTDINNKQDYKCAGYTIRPMKLPLRKHHSFHFQTSQTVAGSKLKANQSNHYKQNGGPLIFKPFLNENSAFKPITPVRNTNCFTNSNNSSNNINLNENTQPRICGTSLKRHMSNIETYDFNRYIRNDSQNLNKDKQIDYNYDEESDMNDEILMTQDNDDGPSSLSNSTMIGKRLIYADLIPLSNSNGHHNSNSKNVSNNSEIDENSLNDDFDDLTINSDSEQFRRNNNHRLRQISHQYKRSLINDLDYDKTAILVTPTKRTTQYATLKFNEVNI